MRWLLPLLLLPCKLFAQNSSARERAEKYYAMGIEYRQGSLKSQLYLDSSIIVDPTFAKGWHEKSVPYLKNGDFITWKPLIDKAVALAPNIHLGTRGWCAFSFLHDYETAIADITALETLLQGYLPSSGNGMYPLRMILGLSYREIGNETLAISTMEKSIASGNRGLYDYLHLAVTYMQVGQWDKARIALEQSIAGYPGLAENYYYLGKYQLQQHNIAAARTSFEKAKNCYLHEFHFIDPYVTPLDAVALEEIEEAIEKLK
ncbi:tetratricopeptide repeat protein [Chitinophaga skermanii]|uniref:Tetratricopeptide repeat protein n=1 Tax=Chitinophaga skermanii TaxID=331697 RepID=A0A327Q6K4_9BACT|nr:tetratricopeptide repeat protein [Chitinophaga skermanii]RAI99391.1 tetratricopeptide repeat protein [Chitinophaga skermanii]